MLMKLSLHLLSVVTRPRFVLESFLVLLFFFFGFFFLSVTIDASCWDTQLSKVYAIACKFLFINFIHVFRLLQWTKFEIINSYMLLFLLKQITTTFQYPYICALWPFRLTLPCWPQNGQDLVCWAILLLSVSLMEAYFQWDSLKRLRIRTLKLDQMF